MATPIDNQLTPEEKEALNEIRAFWAERAEQLEIKFWRELADIEAACNQELYDAIKKSELKASDAEPKG